MAGEALWLIAPTRKNGKRRKAGPKRGNDMAVDHGLLGSPMGRGKSRIDFTRLAVWTATIVLPWGAIAGIIFLAVG